MDPDPWLPWRVAGKALQLLASPQSPALRPVDLQVSFLLSEPRMNIRTIHLAIRVVKDTLSDTQPKVTGQRPRKGCRSGPLPGKRREVGGEWGVLLLAAACLPLQLCGWSPGCLL